MNNKNRVTYKVWYDKELNDYIAIESRDITFGLLVNLKKENIEVKEVSAFSRSDALGEAFPQTKKILKPLSERKYKPKLKAY